MGDVAQAAVSYPQSRTDPVASLTDERCIGVINTKEFLDLRKARIKCHFLLRSPSFVDIVTDDIVTQTLWISCKDLATIASGHIV